MDPLSWIGIAVILLVAVVAVFSRRGGRDGGAGDGGDSDGGGGDGGGD
jgi:hypothetical protein